MNYAENTERRWKLRSYEVGKVRGRKVGRIKNATNTTIDNK
jgi:hypothetical protein